MENERWLSAKDAAPFWGVGECMFRRTAKKANLLTRKAKGRKGVEYALSSFPPDVQRRAKEAAAAESDLTGVTDAEAAENLPPELRDRWDNATDPQRSIAVNRDQLMRLIEEVSRHAKPQRKGVRGERSTLGITGAFAQLRTQYRNGELSADRIAIIFGSLERPGKTRTFPSNATVAAWRAAWLSGGRRPASLVPMDKRRIDPKEENEDPFVIEYLRIKKAKPYLDDVAIHRHLENWGQKTGHPILSLRQISYRIEIGAISQEALAAGLGRGLRRKRQPYVMRDSSGNLLMGVVQADGTTFDAWVWVPKLERFIRPEVWTVLETKTRKIVGFAVGYTENRHVVFAALRLTAQTHGLWGHLCVDGGKGVDNKAMRGDFEGDCTSIQGVAGFQIEFGRARDPNGHGKVERIQGSVHAKAAEQLPTYCGKELQKDRDKYLAFEKLRTRANEGTPDERARVFAKLRSAEMDPFGLADHCLNGLEHFGRWLASSVVSAHNARHHRSIGKSPDAAWLEAFATTPDNLKPTPLSFEEARDLFAIRKPAVMRNGIVTINTLSYYSGPLAEQLHGKPVMVGLLDDPLKVVIQDEVGRVLGYADLDGNKQEEIPLKLQHQALVKTYENKAKRLENKVADVRATTDRLRGATQQDKAPEQPKTSLLATRHEQRYEALLESIKAGTATPEDFEDCKELSARLGRPPPPKEWASAANAGPFENLQKMKAK